MGCGDFKVAAELSKAAIKGNDVYSMSLALQVGDNFFGVRRVTRTFAIDPLENAGRQVLGESISRQRRFDVFPQGPFSFFRQCLRCSIFMVVFLAALLGGHAAAQIAPVEKAGRIRGIVVNAVTHEPIARALVYSPDDRFAMLTDNQGRFEVPLPSAGGDAGGVDSGPNGLQARKPGFLENQFTSSMTLSADGRDSEWVFTLVPEGLIVGKVALPTAEAPDSIQLELYQRQVRQGRAHWVLIKTAQSRSNGDFRLAELASGTYKLLTRELLDRDPLTFDPRGQLYGYPPVYYPASPGFASAGEITAAAGETAVVNLTLLRQPYYNVRIPVTNAQAAGGMNVSVFVAGHPGPGYSLGYNPGDQAIEGMLPNGTYTVEASSYGPNNNVGAGALTFTVRGGGVSGPPMMLIPATSIEVTVKEEFTGTSTSAQKTNEGIVYIGPVSGASKGPRRYLNVALEPADDFGDHRGAWLRPPAGPNDESLVIENVRPGRYWVRVNTSRGYVASARSGATDLQHHPLLVGAGGSPPIEITMRDDTAEIDGTVEGMAAPGSAAGGIAEGRESPGLATAGMAGVHVYCIPLPDSGGTFTDIWVGADGSFRLPQIPPGAYRVLAFARPQPELEYDKPEAMKAFDAKGPVVRLVGRQKENVRLQLISTE